MLGQQYLENSAYQEYLTSHFVLFRADRTQKAGEEVFNKFKIMATPTVMLLDSDGSEIDWHVGYGPPAEKFHQQIDKSYKGVETYKYYADLYAKNPKDVATVFNLAKKYDRRYNQEKAVALYKEAIALDPEGKLGTTEFGKARVPNTQYAEYQIGSMSLFGMKVDVAPMKAFLAKHKEGEMVKAGYQRLASYYSMRGAKEEAVKFLDEAVAKYPDDPAIISSYVRQVINTKENLDKGVELSEHLNDVMKNNPDAMYVKDLAELYSLKNQPEKADSVYGKEFIDGKVSTFAYNILQYANFWSSRNKNTESALAMADLVVKLKPEEDYYLRQAAQIYCAQKNPDKAMEVYGPKYAEKFSSDANKLMGYATFWGEQAKNLEGALSAAKKSTDLAPTNPRCWNALATVYQKMNKMNEAIAMTQKAVDVAPENQKTFYKNKLEVLKKQAGGK